MFAPIFWQIRRPIPFIASPPRWSLTQVKAWEHLLLAPQALLEGGAFNILDKILDASAFLRAQTANCSATFTNCIPFTTAPIVTVFWAPGVDPGTYFNLPSLSFYIPGENDLYILGGVNGDVDNSDTDHFDDTIIIHEFWAFHRR